MDQQTIDNDKAQLAQAKADMEAASQRVIAFTKQLADDEKALEKGGILADLEQHAKYLEGYAGTVGQSVVDHIRDLAARVNALI